MKKISLIVFISLFTIISFAQNEKKEINIIRISFQSSFSTLPELYEIKLNEREVDYISPITTIPAGQEKRETKKFSNRKWNQLTALIEETNIDSLISTESGIDGAWYILNIEYSNGEQKKLKIWNGYASASLIDLRKILLKGK